MFGIPTSILIARHMFHKRLGASAYCGFESKKHISL